MVQHNPLAPGAGRLSELDALRGIAAFLVLVQHARVMGLDPRPFAFLLSGAALSIGLFRFHLLDISSPWPATTSRSSASGR